MPSDEVIESWAFGKVPPLTVGALPEPDSAFRVEWSNRRARRKRIPRPRELQRPVPMVCINVLGESFAAGVTSNCPVPNRECL